jgi:hypothetical protein
MSSNDLEALFANIRPRSRDPSSSNVPPAAPTAARTTSGLSSPIPFVAGNPARMPNSPPPPNNTVNAQSLLNLLNFGTVNPQSPQPATTNPQIQPIPAQSSDPTKNMSASDLVARMMSPAAGEAQTPTTTSTSQNKSGGAQERGDGPETAQSALLKLLSKSRSASSSRAGSAEYPNTSDQNPAAEAQPVLEPAQIQESKPIEQPKPIFTYTNPFEALNNSRKATPAASTPQPKAPVSPIFTTPILDRGSSPSDVLSRRKLTPRSASAKVERIARENSIKSNGTPEPAGAEDSTIPDSTVLPIRPAAGHDPIPEMAQASNVQAEVQPPQEQPVSTREKAAVASAEVGWDPGSKDSPVGAADEWEDAEESESPAPEGEARKIPVYSFPIRPFISLSLQLDEAARVGIRENGVMQISRLKKDFDQLDRSLAAATSKYIGYALTKNGGMRIIRQDDGSDRQVFKHSHDRVFNVAFCTTALSAPPSGHQAILGTGVSGTVYYATVSREGNDLFQKNELESEALSFPPWPPADENSAGGVLKTRAKRSSRHPEYFAIGRGKSIHIIWPETAMFAKYGITDTDRTVDMEKLYQERNLQIATGKAGKDFVFSEDDSMIVSLDKTGRLRFWDIRPLTDEANATAGKIAPIKIDQPLLSLSTASPAEKSWPTSVVMVDKSRPYAKGGAQRYVLVGLRQNHTLQLWDIALGKAVQELNFPHEHETDGVCSVNYHPGSGIIVVGHPTRNSLFFIHLSAPRYALSSSMDQSTYVQRIAAKDPDVPKPDSTACMSGVREISFASMGHLRSVELLPLHKPKTSGVEKSVTDPLFELYAVHSKGVTCLTITKEDLGWDASSKIVDGIDAVKAGIVTMKELKLGSVIEESSRAQSPPEDPSSSSTKSKRKAKKAQKETDTVAPEVVEPVPEPLNGEVLNGNVQQPEPLNGDLLAPKETKKSKKKNGQDLSAPSKTPSRTPSPATAEVAKDIAMEQSATAAVQTPLAPSNVTTESESVHNSAGSTWSEGEAKKLQRGVADEIKKELAVLFTNIQNDRLVQDSTASARQEAVLRLVSQTLTNNVEKSIASIVSAQIQQAVLPAISDVATQAVQANLGGAVSRTLQQLLPNEVAKHIPASVQSALAGAQFNRLIQDSVSQKLVKQIDGQIGEIIKRNLEGVATTAAERSAAAVEARMSSEITKLHEDRVRDAARIEKMSATLSSMAETLKTMSDTQLSFQGSILRDRQELAQMATPQQTSEAQAAPLSTEIARPTPVKPKSAQEREQDDIAELMRQERYEDASIKWLNSPYQVDLFDNLFIRFTPEYLATDVSALVAFSIAVTVSKDMDTNVERRLEWVRSAIDAIDSKVSQSFVA